MTPASNLSRVAVTLTGASSGTACLPYSVAPHTLTCVLLVPARVQGVLDLSIAVGVAAAFDLGQVNVLAADPPGVFAALPACCVMLLAPFWICIWVKIFLCSPRAPQLLHCLLLFEGVFFPQTDA